MPADNVLIQNKQAREAAEEFYELIRESAEKLPTINARLRFYETLDQFCKVECQGFASSSDLAKSGPMTNDEVAAFLREYMPFGQYQGMRIADVPLTYLDWLIGGSESERFKARVRRCLENREVAKQLSLQQLSTGKYHEPED